MYGHISFALGDYMLSKLILYIDIECKSLKNEQYSYSIKTKSVEQTN